MVSVAMSMMTFIAGLGGDATADAGHLGNIVAGGAEEYACLGMINRRPGFFQGHAMMFSACTRMGI